VRPDCPPVNGPPVTGCVPCPVIQRSYLNQT
jgi:hypothetical protein